MSSENVYEALKQVWAIAKASGANIFGVEIGIVTNVKDPDKAGRVKVCFPRLPGNPESDWARVGQPAAGPGRGFYWIPQVNDEVLVMFERGQANAPYVIGTLWNGKDKPMKDGYTDENTKIMVQTKSGHQLVLEDKKDAELITLGDKSGNRTITWDVKNKKFLIEAKEGDLEIHAEKKFVLQCEDLEIKSSKSTKYDVGTTFDLKITDKAGMKAGPQMNIKAQKVDLNPPNLIIEALITAAEAAVQAVAAAEAEQQQQAAQDAADDSAGGGADAAAGGDTVPSSDASDQPAADTTQAPSSDTTEAPSDTTTGAPSDTTTGAPSETTTGAPSETTTGAPSSTTTGAPSSTTTQPASTTTAPGTTTTAPGSTTTAPGSTTTAPGSTTTAPGSTTTAPG
ncbi:MAG TPA: phage baseplate assembly protein V, partial [Myxococcales bacterium]|nr:phage baseplate assembly protein V [Myxococcales bacterium]